MQKLNNNDHDILIDLRAKFDIFIRQYAIDMKELKDGTNAKLVDHEGRLKIIERVHEEINPKQVVKDFTTLQQEYHDFKLTWKQILIIVSGTSVVIGFVLGTLIQLINLFK